MNRAECSKHRCGRLRAFPFMPTYLIAFDQNWVGNHTEAWFMSRGPLARAVVEEMKAAGVFVFAGGLIEELDEAFHALQDGSVKAGPYEQRANFMGGFTIVQVETEDGATMWASKVAEACGWPQELRRFKD